MPSVNDYKVVRLSTAVIICVTNKNPIENANIYDDMHVMYNHTT